jgi:hypothetical protein
MYLHNLQMPSSAVISAKAHTHVMCSRCPPIRTRAPCHHRRNIIEIVRACSNHLVGPLRMILGNLSSQMSRPGI